ncbi:MAG: hypothetical protein QOJ25_402 [Solirubrobacteraceae bacterium]|nr:hypothetical protein [Solirubrobacteraceae bacterium]
MPRIVIQAIPPDGERADITLSERVAAANLNAPHYSAQLLERLTWATADAEALESRARPREPGERPIPSPLLEQRTSARDLARLQRDDLLAGRPQGSA